MINAAGGTLAFMEGPELLLVVFAVLPLVLGIWALIDASSRPEWAWQQVGSSRTLYIVLIAVGFFVFGIVSLVTSIVYLTSTRHRLAAAMTQGAWGGQARAAQAPYGPTPTTAPPGWYPDPRDPARQRWWDGIRWTEHQH
jgi:hypothetical protein